MNDGCAKLCDVALTQTTLVLVVETVDLQWVGLVGWVRGRLIMIRDFRGVVATGSALQANGRLGIHSVVTRVHVLDVHMYY